MGVIPVKVEIIGTDRLAKKLQQKSATDFTAISKKNMRDIFTRSQQGGGTPVDTNELRRSARYNGEEMGYTAEHGPHVEYGHRTLSGGYVPGQYFLKANVDIQRPIYRSDLKEELRK